jgi:hypothetical protein
MSTAVMTERIAEASPRFNARLAGLLYLAITIAAPFGELFVRGKLIVNRDAAATATNILAHESLYVAYFAPLLLLGGAPHLSVFNLDQLQALALLCLSLHGQGYNLGLVFFGFHCVLVGYLIWRSTFLPRILGWLMAIAGLCYLINSFTSFLAPSLKAQIYPYVLMPAGIAELSLTAWLLVIGVNVGRWKEQANKQRE